MLCSQFRFSFQSNVDLARASKRADSFQEGQVYIICQEKIKDLLLSRHASLYNVSSFSLLTNSVDRSRFSSR